MTKALSLVPTLPRWVLEQVLVGEHSKTLQADVREAAWYLHKMIAFLN